MAALREVSDESFEREVLSAGRSVVVDFWAPWCRPCEAVAPVLESLAEDYPGVTFARLDIDTSPLAGARFDVLSIPTVILFDGGQPRATLTGARSRDEYEKAWARWLRTTS